MAEPASHQAWPAALPVLIPVYNHASKIGVVIENLQLLNAQITVVDDGSTDGSGDIARQYGVTVLSHAMNQGKAAALQTGLRHLADQGAQAALTCDADGQHLAQDAYLLAEVFVTNQNDDSQATTPIIYVGHRNMPHAPIKSKAGRWWSNAAASLLSGQKLRDTQSGLRIYPLPVTTNLPSKIDGFAFEIEVLVLAAWAGIRIEHQRVSVVYDEERISHFAPWRDTLRAMACLGSLCMRRCFSRTSCQCRQALTQHRPAVTPS